MKEKVSQSSDISHKLIVRFFFFSQFMFFTNKAQFVSFGREGNHNILSKHQYLHLFLLLHFKDYTRIVNLSEFIYFN